MKNKEEIIASIKIIFFIIIFLAIIIIPIIINNNKTRNKENFPKYQNIEITKKELSNDNETIKKQLQNNFYFIKLSTMMDYDSRNYSPQMISKLLWYYMFNYELSNNKYFYEKVDNSDIYCISKKNLINGFKELFDIDISNSVNVLEGYFDYLYKNRGGYCLNFNRIATDYTNEAKVAIKELSTNGKVITADLYLYEYYVSNTEKEKEYVSELRENINNNNYDECNNIVSNMLYGTITHKEIKFKKNNNGEFFKYKILSSKKIDY